MEETAETAAAPEPELEATPAPEPELEATPALASELEATPAPASETPKKSKKRFWNIVMAVSSLVLVCSLAAIGVITYSYMQGKAAYDQLASLALHDQIPEANQLKSLKVDWDALREINPDVVAWVYVPGTVINYPVVRTDDNDTYLHTDFNGNRSWGASFGTIFMDFRNTGDFTDANNIMYGHNMNNGSMFAGLADFRDETFFNEHRDIFVLTPAGNYRLRTFSLVHMKELEPVIQVNFDTNHERNAYVTDKMERTEAQPNPATPGAEYLGTTFMFVTCDNWLFYGRYLLYASVVESTVPNGQKGAAVGSKGNVPTYIDDETKEGLGKVE